MKSGAVHIYVFRLAVPGILRPFVGKREIIISTGTTELALAKIAAGAAATQWRQRFIDLSRLLAVGGTNSMDYQEILKVVTGSPSLLAAGHLPLPMASSASGLTVDHLLRAASEGRLRLHVRAGPTAGHLVPEDQLELVDAFLGPASGRIVPPSRHMPSGAVSHSLDRPATSAQSPTDRSWTVPKIGYENSFECSEPRGT